MTNQIVLTGYIDIPLEEIDLVAAALEVHKKLTRAEPAVSNSMSGQIKNYWGGTVSTRSLPRKTHLMPI